MTASDSFVQEARVGNENTRFVGASDTIAAASKAPANAGRVELPFPGELNLGLVALILVSTVVLYFVTRPTIELVSFAPYGLIISICLFLSYYVRRAAFSDVFQQRMYFLLKGLAFIFVALITLRLFNHLTMSLAFPLADNLLNGWDNALGLNWVAYFSFVQSRPFLSRLLEVAYVAFDVASVLGFLVLVVAGYLRRARYFCEIFLITAAASTFIAMFFPAMAAVSYHLGEVSSVPGFADVPGVYHLKQFVALRTEQVPTINLLSAAGLATFPSFHTAGGILLIAGFLRTRFSWAVLVFAGIMFASVPVFGAHYFVDMIAGTFLAMAVCVLNARRSCYRGLFAKDAARY